MNEPRHSDYSEKNFWEKLKRQALRAGRPVVEKALQLFYALKSPRTPKWAKTVIIGALAYFIIPTDAIPDFIPVAGYSDDLGALAAAIATVQVYINDDVRKAARAKLKEVVWEGSGGGGVRAVEGGSATVAPLIRVRSGDRNVAAHRLVADTNECPPHNCFDDVPWIRGQTPSITAVAPLCRTPQSCSPRRRLHSRRSLR